jgi:hypothetical protein
LRRKTLPDTNDRAAIATHWYQQSQTFFATQENLFADVLQAAARIAIDS